MDNQYPFTTSPEERAQRRVERIAARKERIRRRRLQMLMRLIPLVILILLGIFALGWFLDQNDADASKTDDIESVPSEPITNVVSPEESEEPYVPYSVTADANTKQMGAELPSEYAILIDLENNSILAEKGAKTVVSPASMTKILTILTAADAIESESQLNDTVTIDLEITDYCYFNGCSAVGYSVNEAVPVRELFYSTILPSGADAALALARYVAGSHEEFVELMNEKVKELGLSDTAHFANCVGLYDENNVCTVYDMAMILKAAMDDELCREVLTTKIYRIPANEFHSSDVDISNWFLRRIDDRIGCGIEVIGAKTGYVYESGNCAASYAENSDRGRFICVTADALGASQCIDDHVQIYEQFCAVEETAVAGSEGSH